MFTFYQSFQKAEQPSRTEGLPLSLQRPRPELHSKVKFEEFFDQTQFTWVRNRQPPPTQTEIEKEK